MTPAITTAPICNPQIPQTSSKSREVSLEKRVAVLALGILSSAVILAAVPEVGPFLALAISITVLSYALDPVEVVSYHPHVVRARPLCHHACRSFSLIEDLPVVLFPKHTQGRTVAPSYREERVPVGRRESFLETEAPFKMPPPPKFSSSLEERVPVGFRERR